MKRAALALALVAASSGVAAAGGYVGLGIGTGPEISTDRDTEYTSNGRSKRLLGGIRFSRFSVEGAATNFDMLGPAPHTVWQASASAKVNFALGDGFEAFGRLGMQKTWVSLDRGRDGDEIYDVEGTGYIAGAGIEYRLNLAAANVSLFVDYQYASADLEGERAKYSLGARMWTLGAILGF